MANLMPTLIQALTAILLAVGAGAAGFVGIIAGVWYNRYKKNQERKDALAAEALRKKDILDDMKQMDENAKMITSSIEQLWPNLPGAEKAKLAAQWTLKMNTELGIDPKLQLTTVPDPNGNPVSLPTIKTEAAVNSLPSNPSPAITEG